LSVLLWFTADDYPFCLNFYTNNIWSKM